MSDEIVFSINRPLKSSLSDFNDESFFLFFKKIIDGKSIDKSLSDKFIEIIKHCSIECEYLFEDPFFTDKLDPRSNSELVPIGEENVLSLVFPTLLNVYSKFYINTPTILSGERLEIFKLHFNPVEFLVKFQSDFRENIDILDRFEFIDHYQKICELISEDYVSEKIKMTVEVRDYVSEIRNLKIKNGLNI